MADKPLKYWVRIWDLIRDQYWWVLTDETSGMPESLDRILEVDMPADALAQIQQTPTGRSVIQDSYVRKDGKGKAVTG